jgi:hypothetical protein
MEKELEDRIICAINTTWEAVAYDWMEAFGINKIKRDEIFEAVVDADRMVTYGNDPEAVEYFYGLGTKEMKKVFKKAFPYKVYEF